MDIWPNSQNSLNPSAFKCPNNVMIKQNNYMFHQICLKKLFINVVTILFNQSGGSIRRGGRPGGHTSLLTFL